MRKLRVAPVLLALTIGACHNGPTAINGPNAISTARVRVDQVSDEIRVENLTDKGMAYLPDEPGRAPTLRLGPVQNHDA